MDYLDAQALLICRGREGVVSQASLRYRQNYTRLQQFSSECASFIYTFHTVSAGSFVSHNASSAQDNSTSSNPYLQPTYNSCIMNIKPLHYNNLTFDQFNYPQTPRLYMIASPFSEPHNHFFSAISSSSNLSFSILCITISAHSASAISPLSSIGFSPQVPQNRIIAFVSSLNCFLVRPSIISLYGSYFHSTSPSLAAGSLVGVYVSLLRKRS